MILYKYPLTFEHATREVVDADGKRVSFNEQDWEDIQLDMKIGDMSYSSWVISKAFAKLAGLKEK